MIDTKALKRLINQYPMVLFFLMLSLLVTLIVWFGDNIFALHWLSFSDFYIQGNHLIFGSIAQTLSKHEWWRFVTPIFIHFSVLHLAMNALWFWELGRRIEAYQGSWTLLSLTLLFGVVSNMSQYLASGSSLFGGLSGVIYGLLGYCAVYQKLAPTPAYRLPQGILVTMLLWLLVCMTGIFELLKFGSIANAAHMGGLLSGAALGLIYGLQKKYSLKKVF